MVCKDCEDKARDRALTYLTGAERRKYLRSMKDLFTHRPGMELLALAYRRVQADIVICHRCATRCGSEGDLSDWNKVHNLHLCTECLQILMDDVVFCCSCLQLLKGSEVGHIIPTFEKGDGPYFVCTTCLPAGHHCPMDLDLFLGGHQFIPIHLGVCS